MKKLAVDKVFCLRCGRGFDGENAGDIGSPRVSIESCDSCGFMVVSESGKLRVWWDTNGPVNHLSEWADVPEGCLMVMDGVEL